MQPIKLTVTLLIGFLVIGFGLPAAAQEMTINSSTVDLIRSHLDKALDGLNRLNLQRAFNHINRALAHLPNTPSVSVGWFAITTPFTWSKSNGPMPLQIGAMIGDGTPQPLYTGTVVLSMVPSGQIIALYDQQMVLLSGTQTRQFVNGSWQGYIMVGTPSGLTESIALKAVTPDGTSAGVGYPVRWIVP